MIGGGIVSYTFILGTNSLAQYYGGTLWPGRFIGFSIGMIIFTALTYFIMNEGINTKTLISLMLSIILLCVQLFWK